MIKHPRLAALFIIGLVFLGLTVAAWLLAAPVPEFIQGEVEATKVNVSAKIPGRVEELLVPEGGRAERGELLAVLDSPQLEAKRRQAEGARAAASAQRDKAETGAREEEIRAAYNKYLQAQAGAELARKSFERVDRLFQDGVVPAQRRDEVQAQYEMALKLTAAAQALHEMAVRGAREEDKAAAAALVEQASGAVLEVESLIEESRVRAPIAGEVLQHIVKVGELASAGMPIATIIDLDDVWVTFNVREDRLGGLQVGDPLHAMAPALNYQPISLEVTFIAALGDFATWRATSAQGGFDLRTFEVRARPAGRAEGLRPGMSVIVPWDRVPPRDPVAQMRGTLPRWLRDLLPGHGAS